MLAGHAEPTEPQVARAVVAALPDGATLVVSSSMPVRDVEWYAAPRRRRPRAWPTAAPTASTAWCRPRSAWPSARGRPTALLIGDVAFLHDTNGLLGAAGAGHRPHHRGGRQRRRRHLLVPAAGHGRRPPSGSSSSSARPTASTRSPSPRPTACRAWRSRRQPTSAPPSPRRWPRAACGWCGSAPTGRPTSPCTTSSTGRGGQPVSAARHAGPQRAAQRPSEALAHAP